MGIQVKTLNGEVLFFNNMVDLFNNYLMKNGGFIEGEKYRVLRVFGGDMRWRGYKWLKQQVKSNN
jgi:hypothetical protein